jgi:exosortase
MSVTFDATRDGSSNGWRRWALLASIALIGILGRHALYSLLQLAFSNAEYSHILLVLPIVLAFVILERNHEKLNSSSSLLGVVLVLLGVAVWFSARIVPAVFGLTLQISAVVLWIWASVFLIYGWKVFRAALFPMLFLLLLIPWPAPVVEKLTELLQAGSTAAAFWMFKMAGIAVTRQGFVISLPSMDIEVAKECSGIRSTVMLFVTTLVLGQWYLTSTWRKMLLALLVFFIGILRNGLRIFILSVLGTYVNEGWLDGNLHHRGGVAFFVLGLAMIVLVLWLLKRSETGHRPKFAHPSAARSSANPTSSGGRCDPPTFNPR